MNTKKTSSSRRWVVIIIYISMILATLFVFLKIYFSEERIVNIKLDALAREYYEDYFYDRYLESSNYSIEDTFARFSERGIGKTYLRQLLVFNRDRGGDAREKIGERCDPNKTYVTYYPKSPYGKTDYEFKYVYSCNFD